MQKKKEPVLVAMSNQKGGVGKSSLTILLASYLHYVKDKNIAVLDCDSPQHSLSNLREREKKVLQESGYHQQLMVAQFERLGKKAYPILNSTPQHASQAARDLIASHPTSLDLVFIDLPGSISSEGVLRTIVNVDYVITPIIPDRMVMQSTLAFSNAVLSFTKERPDIPLKDFYFVWNRIDGRVSPLVLTAYNAIMEKLNLSVLNTKIPERCRYGKEISVGSKDIFRSSLFPSSKNLLTGSGLPELADELCNLLNL